MGATVRPLALTSSFVVGWFSPQGAVLSQSIPPFVRFMLFMAFLGQNVHKIKPRLCYFAILTFNILIGAAARDSLGGRHGAAQNASDILENLVARRTSV